MLLRAVISAAALWAALTSAVAGACNTYGLFDRVGAKYGLDPVLLYAVSLTESGARPDAIGKNKNGTYDHGAMQINTIHLPRLRELGIAKSDLFNPCVNVDVGAWVLSQCFARWGNSWDGVGCYNSNTPKYRAAYAKKVESRYAKLKGLAPKPNQTAERGRFMCAATAGCFVVSSGGKYYVAAATGDPRVSPLFAE